MQSCTFSSLLHAPQGRLELHLENVSLWSKFLLFNYCVLSLPWLDPDGHRNGARIYLLGLSVLRAQNEMALADLLGAIFSPLPGHLHFQGDFLISCSFSDRVYLYPIEFSCVSESVGPSICSRASFYLQGFLPQPAQGPLMCSDAIFSGIKCFHF